MADTLFVNATTTVPGTPIVAPWMNDVNTAVYATLVVSGANNITATGPVSMTSYTVGQRFFFMPAGNNTTGVTININGLGFVNVTKLGAISLIAQDLLVGTMAEIVYDGTNFQLLDPQTFNLTQTVPATNISSFPPVGQCKLTTSGANIILNRLNGYYITINNAIQTIPAAGVQLSPAGTAANTRYYIYAFMNAGTMTLEYSTTVPVVDTATGVTIKTGDVTRTLVGQAQVVSAGSWVNTTTNRYVSSWFNRTDVVGRLPLTAGPIGTSSAALVELDIGYRVATLVWAGETVTIGHSGTLSLNAAGTTTLVFFSVSGVMGVGSVLDGGSNTGFTAAGSATAGMRNTFLAPSDGFIVLGVQGATNAGTLSITNAAGVRGLLFIRTLG